MYEKEPNIEISAKEFVDSGFTISGCDQYEKTVKDYSKTLFDRAIGYAEIGKAVTREVTHDHVKAAAYSIANSFGKPIVPKWMGIVKIGQYLCAGLVGLFVNHLDKLWGVILFIVAFATGSVFLYVETIRK